MSAPSPTDFPLARSQGPGEVQPMSETMRRVIWGLIIIALLNSVSIVVLALVTIAREAR